jgi:hypothetical protein
MNPFPQVLLPCGKNSLNDPGDFSRRTSQSICRSCFSAYTAANTERIPLFQPAGFKETGTLLTALFRLIQAFSPLSYPAQDHPINFPVDPVILNHNHYPVTLIFW